MSITINDKEIVEIRNPFKGCYLTWIINNICNNSCFYCPSDVHNGKNHHYDWIHVEKFLNEVNERYGPIHINISGGEPTMSPWFKKMVNKIYDNGGAIGVTTNLIKRLSYWKEGKDEIFDKFQYINCSFHPGSVPFDEYEKYEEEFFEKAYYISKKTNVSVRVMMVPEKKIWDKIIKTFDKYNKYIDTLGFEPVRILPNFGVGEDYCEINYSQEQIEWLNNYVVVPKKIWLNNRTIFQPPFPTLIYTKDYDFGDRSWCEQKLGSNEDIFTHDLLIKMTNNQLNNFYGWKCEIGVESLFVHYFGSIQRGNCGVGGEIGNIKDIDNVKWPKGSIQCNKTMCHCASDILMSKKIN